MEMRSFFFFFERIDFYFLALFNTELLSGTWLYDVVSVKWRRYWEEAP